LNLIWGPAIEYGILRGDSSSGGIFKKELEKSPVAIQQKTFRKKDNMH
jgi:hypothetical protein